MGNFNEIATTILNVAMLLGGCCGIGYLIKKAGAWFSKRRAAKSFPQVQLTGESIAVLARAVADELERRHDEAAT